MLNPDVAVLNPGLVALFFIFRVLFSYLVVAIVDLGFFLLISCIFSFCIMHLWLFSLDRVCVHVIFFSSYFCVMYIQLWSFVSVLFFNLLFFSHALTTVEPGVYILFFIFFSYHAHSTLELGPYFDFVILLFFFHIMYFEVKSLDPNVVFLIFYTSFFLTRASAFSSRS